MVDAQWYEFMYIKSSLTGESALVRKQNLRTKIRMCWILVEVSACKTDTYPKVYCWQRLHFLQAIRVNSFLPQQTLSSHLGYVYITASMLHHSWSSILLRMFYTNCGVLTLLSRHRSFLLEDSNLRSHWCKRTNIIRSGVRLIGYWSS